MRHTTKWTLNPPAGVRFVNEFGSGVTIEFPTDMLDEVYMTLFQQLQQWRTLTEKMEAARAEKEAAKLQSLPQGTNQVPQMPSMGGEQLTITVTPIKKAEG